MPGATSPIGDLDQHAIRFADVERRRSGYRPPDMALARYERERYAVAGRPAEGTTAGTRLGADTRFRVVYLKCEPGNGVGMHAHAAAEVFIPMTGRWAAIFEGGKGVALDPRDVVSVPPGIMHGLENIGDEPAPIMATNAGTAGAPIRLPPKLRRETEAAGGKAGELTIPGQG